MQAAYKRTWHKCRNENNEQLRWLSRVRRSWLEEGKPRKVKHDQAVWITLWVRIFTHKNRYCHTAGLTVRLRSIRCVSPSLAWCYWSALVHKGDSSLIWRLQYPNRIAETFPSATSYSKQCILLSSQAPGLTWWSCLKPQKASCCSLPCRLLPCFCHIDTFLAYLQGKYISDPKLCGLSMLLPHHKEPNCWNQRAPTNGKQPGQTLRPHNHPFLQ